MRTHAQELIKKTRRNYPCESDQQRRSRWAIEQL